MQIAGANRTSEVPSSFKVTIEFPRMHTNSLSFITGIWKKWFQFAEWKQQVSRQTGGRKNLTWKHSRQQTSKHKRQPENLENSSKCDKRRLELAGMYALATSFPGSLLLVWVPARTRGWREHNFVTIMRHLEFGRHDILNVSVFRRLNSAPIPLG